MDVDGSYLERKHKQMIDAGMTVTPIGAPAGTPLAGWEVMTEANVKNLAKKLPQVTSGDSLSNVGLFIMNIFPLGAVYTYLASGAGRTQSEGTFCALTRGFLHWVSGRIDSIEVNVHNPLHVHIRSSMKPSMKQGNYRIWILLQREDDLATVRSATCECAVG